MGAAKKFTPPPPMCKICFSKQFAQILCKYAYLIIIYFAIKQFEILRCLLTCYNIFGDSIWGGITNFACVGLFSSNGSVKTIRYSKLVYGFFFYDYFRSFLVKPLICLGFLPSLACFMNLN